MKRALRWRQRGQSMTEFVVAAAFVMIPLFLIVPTIGKYIDMKQATVQAARYTSWEYTANYVDLSDQPGGFTAIPQIRMPRKKQVQVAAEARRRYFSDTALPLDSTADLTGYSIDQANPMWRFHSGLAMYDPGNDALALRGSDKSPDALGVSKLFGTIGSVAGSFGSLLRALGLNVGFDVVNPDRDFSIDGLFASRVDVAVNEAPDYTGLDADGTAPLFGRNLNLVMTAKSGILTESWAAGGKAHTVYQAGGLIPSALIGKIVSPIQNILSWISPELNSSSLKFGYPVDDPDVMDEVPPGALEGDTEQVDCPGGYCEN